MAKVALPRLHKAVRFAMKAHKKQDRDGESPVPYVIHPLDVLNTVRYEGEVVDEDVLCAAALHDVLEETDATESELTKRFGGRVTALVRELTREEPDRTGLSEAEVWTLRTRTMLAEIGKMSSEAKAIKLADRASNLRAALVTREGDDLHRYVRQSQLILERIDASIAPAIRSRVKEMAASVTLPKAIASLTVAAPKPKTKPKAQPKPKKPVKNKPEQPKLPTNGVKVPH